MDPDPDPVKMGPDPQQGLELIELSYPIICGLILTVTLTVTPACVRVGELGVSWIPFSLQVIINIYLYKDNIILYKSWFYYICNTVVNLLMYGFVSYLEVKNSFSSYFR